jgi:1-deoxy-D-xylulose-5-phosphate reductoisomerase
MNGRGRRVVLLGSTGSIGTQTLDVVERLNERGEALCVVALAARRNTDRLAAQVARLHPEVVSIADPSGAEALRERFPGLFVLEGEEGLAHLARWDADIVVNALVGAVGLVPTLEALSLGRAVALANKESVVVGGDLLTEAAREGGGTILPVDSEPCAVSQCLRGGALSEVRRVLLTASGGPFLRASPADLALVTPEQALRHPTWRMGRRITVDSATLANKGFEVIEAHHLFDLPYDRIDVIVHPESLVHALVEWEDGSLVAGVAPPDMRIPIALALAYPERRDTGLPRWEAHGRMTFEPLDRERFPGFRAVAEAGVLGGTAPAAVNAADEVLVERFLSGEIRFPAIAQGLLQVLSRWKEERAGGAQDLVARLATDCWARGEAGGLRFERSSLLA